MNSQERKLQQRIARRKEKVQRLLREQETYLAALVPSSFLCYKNYLQAMSTARKKLHRLKQELLVLGAGHLHGPWG